ncbi:hypothetical protein G6O69_00345 [Pseudenhygromyxa sp. WMMC2535]|uniref:hypothetical protein n=1 Tax=Pseudenhygromyxa sp. WMMC2535 TaxID=2712867 RepID=UPI001557AD64|nr:hypothetical protein [Pseudenhygromyxa sp. WMMC2535]NVB36259.1 hypothetical protein [Pseudenhygromyxa sp. WMMC2535]
MSAALLALAKDPPNLEAVAISPTIGWLMLACVVCLALVFAMHAEKWRRWWLSAEDPRSIAVFRIVFAFLVICNINGMWEFFGFLFTDEGIFTADVARQVFAREQFAGYGDGLRPDDPEGFYDLAAVWEFLKGPKYSLLFFWDSPTAFWIHLIAFEVSALMLMIGFRTRLFGVLTWFLMNSILVRNSLPWEGTEVVFRVMLAYLILARSGHAYSVDNWLRCRKLRKQGRLSERDGPGKGAGLAPSEDYPQGLEPIYRSIPSWPRKLLMLQLATVYVTTGTLKTGAVWMAGDSLYYALNLDHFYRLPPQYMASLLGTHVFRGMTWAVKIGQTMFPMIMFGVIARWVMDRKFAPLPAAKAWIARAAFAGMILCSAAIIWVAYPVHITPKISAAAFTGIWVGLWVGFWLLWLKLGRAPWRITKIFGRELDEAVVIDRAWMCRWIFGRRVLLVWHLAFHAHIFTLMNVGQFQTAMVACTLVFLKGEEIAAIFRDVGHRMAKVSPRVFGKLLPKAVVERAAIVPPADPSLPTQHRDTATLPDWAVLLGIAGVVGGVLVRVELEPSWDYRLIWLATAAGLLGVIAWRVRATRGQRVAVRDPSTGGRRDPWAYGPTARLLVGLVLAWHMSAVAIWLMPGKDSLSSFRPAAREAVATWLQTTQTTQGWGMFAPNPPRSNVFLKVVVTDAEGEDWDLRTDVYAEEQKPIPWIWNDRRRKMNRRMAGKGEWYRKWYARYECREWAREHGGEMPEKVHLIKVWYRIPKPETVKKTGYYIAEERLEQTKHQKVLYEASCAREVMGQLPNFIRERDGLPLLDDGVYRPWHKHKRRKWEKEHPKEEEEPESGPVAAR